MSTKLEGVMETLLITLCERARDAASPTPCRATKWHFKYPKSSISKFDSAWLSYYGVLARAPAMDKQVRSFISKNPDCVIVSMGCGLDTRFFRVDNGQITWIFPM